MRKKKYCTNWALGGFELSVNYAFDLNTEAEAKSLDLLFVIYTKRSIEK